MDSESDTTDSELTLKSDQFAIFFLEALSKPDIIVKLKSAVGYDEENLSKKIVNDLNTRIKVLEKDLAKKEDRINTLEKQVEFLTIKNDDQEQYSRRNILRINGLPESNSSNETVVKFCNEMLNVPISIEDIDRSHRIGLASSPQPSAPDNQAAVTNRGPQAPAGEVPSVAGTTEGDNGSSDGQSNNARRAEGVIAEPDQLPLTNQPPGRVIMVKFTNYRARDVVFRAKSKLKTHNAENPDRKIFINEDLTKFRANLCFEARKLKPHILREVWTHDGRVLVKDARHRVHLIKNMRDLQQFQ